MTYICKQRTKVAGNYCVLGCSAGSSPGSSESRARRTGMYSNKPRSPQERRGRNQEIQNQYSTHLSLFVWLPSAPKKLKACTLCLNRNFAEGCTEVWLVPVPILQGQASARKQVTICSYSACFIIRFISPSPPSTSAWESSLPRYIQREAFACPPNSGKDIFNKTDTGLVKPVQGLTQLVPDF